MQDSLTAEHVCIKCGLAGLLWGLGLGVALSLIGVGVVGWLAFGG